MVGNGQLFHELNPVSRTFRTFASLTFLISFNQSVWSFPFRSNTFLLLLLPFFSLSSAFFSHVIVSKSSKLWSHSRSPVVRNKRVRRCSSTLQPSWRFARLPLRSNWISSVFYLNAPASSFKSPLSPPSIILIISFFEQVEPCSCSETFDMRARPNLYPLDSSPTHPRAFLALLCSSRALGAART